MLNLSTSIADGLVKHLILMKVKSKRAARGKDIGDLIEKLKYSIIRAAVDAFVVGGIVFFSSVISLGYLDLFMNVKFAFISATFTAGLSFFTELRKMLEGKNKI